MTKPKVERDRGPHDPAPSPVPGPVEKTPRPSPKRKSQAVAKLPMRPASLLVLIDRFARDPLVDPAKYRALLDMQKEVRRDEAEREFTRDFNRMLPVLPEINKDNKIVILPKSGKPGEPGKKGQETPYATLDNIMRHLRPILAEHHFGFQWSSTVVPVGEHGQLQHVCTGRLSHDNGHYRESSWPIAPETTGSKNEAQARGSGSSYAKRYTLRDLIPIISKAPQDHDDDGATVAKVIEPEPEPTIDQPTQNMVDGVMTENSVTLEIVQKSGWKIKKTADLKVSEVQKFIEACRAYGKRKKAKEQQGGQPAG